MSLAAKMVLAMKDIDAVLKNGRNDFQKYNYVRAADVANEARKAMIAHGIAFTFDVVNAQHWESTKEGKSTNYFCQLTVNCTFTDSESGEQLAGRVIGWGTDTLDKAPFKAMTGALKYALRMNFLIPDENDPEDTAIEEMRHSKTDSAPQQRAPSNGNAQTISEAQSKRFFALAKAGNKTNDQVRAYLLNVCKCEKSLEITRDKYDAACKWAESKPSPTSPDPLEITDDDIPF